MDWIVAYAKRNKTFRSAKVLVQKCQDDDFKQVGGGVKQPFRSASVYNARDGGKLATLAKPDAIITE